MPLVLRQNHVNAELSAEGDIFRPFAAGVCKNNRLLFRVFVDDPCLGKS